MFKHNLFNLLKTFNESEINKFHEYLISPYFNHSNKMITLFEKIIKYYPEFNKEDLTKEYFCQSFYPKHNYVDSELRKDLSHLLKLSEDFLIMENFKYNKFSHYPCLLRELTSRNQNGLFEKIISSYEEDLSLKNINSDIFLYNKYLIEKEKLNYSDTFRKIIKKDVLLKEVDCVTMTGVYLTTFYLKEIITAYFNIIFYSNEFNLNTSSNTLIKLINNLNIEKMMKIVNKNNKFSFILELYYALVKTFKEYKNEKYYFLYKHLLYKSKDILCISEVSFHFFNLLNYCTIKIDSNKNNNFNDELLCIYKEILEKEYYKINKDNYLSKILFRNAICHGISLKKYEWVEKVINDYYTKLSPQCQSSMFSYGYAILNNAIGKYEISIEYCNNIEMDYYQFKYDLKNLILKNYYELNYFDEIFSQIDFYKHFLNNDLLQNNYFKKCYKSFIYYMEKLVLFKSGINKIYIATLYKKLQSEENLSYKSWLLTKYEEVYQKQRITV